MTRDFTFIDPPMSLLLDVIRGLSAVAVLLGHAVQMELYTGPYPFDGRLQHTAVVIFFVLSGLVIGHSASRPNTDLRSFAIARVARIAPVALLAVAFSAALASYAHLAGLQDGSVAPYDSVSLQTTIVPLLFLGESVPASGLVWNPPFWSLAYEVWFYALFGSAWFLRGGLRIAVVGLLVLVAGWKVLLLMPVWLVGVVIVSCQRWLCLSRAKALGVLLAGVLFLTAAIVLQAEARAVLLAATGLDEASFRFSVDAMSDYLAALGVALSFAGIRPWIGHCEILLEGWAMPIRWLAGCSFTLYLIHWPLLMLVRGHGITAGESLLGLVGLLIFVLVSAAILAEMVERQSPRLRRWITARLARQPLAA